MIKSSLPAVLLVALTVSFASQAVAASPTAAVRSAAAKLPPRLGAQHARRITVREYATNRCGSMAVPQTSRGTRGHSEQH
jgi:hypothetical protein